MTIRCALLVGLTLVFSAAVAPAQLFVYPFTESAVGVYATDGIKPALNFKPAKKLFPNTDRRFSATAAGVVAGVQTHLVLSNRGFRIREFCYVDAAATKGAGGTTASTSVTSIKPGVHSYILNVRGAAKSTLVVTMAGTKTGNGKVAVTLDIGADNKIEFSQTATGTTVRRTFPITGGSPNPVRITVNGSASWTQSGSSYDMTVMAWIQNPVRKDCFPSRYAKPCGKVNLMGFDAPTASNLHSLTLNITGAPPNAPALIGIGVTSARFTLPGIPCPVVILPIAYVYPRTDASGNATMVFNVNTKLKHTAYLQCAVADAKGKTTRMSNGLRLDCMDQ